MAGLIENPTAIALAWSLVHFLWQGGAIALTTVAIMRLGRLSASARYTTGIVALAAMLLAPIVTFLILVDAPLPVAQTMSGSASVASAAGIASFAPASSSLASVGLSAPSIILIVWSCGVVVLSVRLFGGWVVARRMARRSLQPVSQEVQVLARRVAARLALDRLVGVFESSAVAVPVMIGWLRPVVLLPAAAMSGLSMAQVEALLAHELAHVRRHDYLVNLLQSAVETLLFYHPAVWWVSRRVRVDREHCCDDLALAVCDRVVYARALTDLAALTVVPRVALAATDGPLLGRVRRILGQSGDHAPAGSAWMSALMAVLIVGSLVPSAMTAAREDERSIPQPSVVLVEQTSPGVPNGVPNGVPSGVKSSSVTKPRARVSHEPVSDVSDGAVVTQDKPPQGTTAAAQAELEKARRKLEEAAAREEQLKAGREQLDKMQVELAAKQINEKMRAALQAFELRMAEAKEKYGRASDAFQRGLISKDEAAKAEMDMQRIKQEYEAVSRQYQLELEKFQTDKIKEQYDKNVVEYKRLLSEAETERMAAILELQGRKLTERELAMARAEPVTSPTEQVRPADILIIEIHNEPDLPRAFVVQPDGTIRLPLMGPIKVQGQTTRQVQEAIGKKLASIGASSGVTVGLRRGVGK